jgi:hypothetical protein
MLKEQLVFSFVDIVSIQSTISRANFSAALIEDLAQSFLAIGGTVKPIIVKMIGFESYQVVFGDLEFYAALRAREINDNFELVRVLIIPSGKEESIINQMNLLESATQTPARNVLNEESFDDCNVDILTILKNQDDNIRTQLETFNLLIKDLVSSSQRLHQRIDVMAQEAYWENLSFLERFNTLSEADLYLCLRNILGEKKARRVLVELLKEREKKVFESLEDVFTRVYISQGNRKQRAFGEKTALRLLEEWSNVSFKHLKNKYSAN